MKIDVINLMLVKDFWLLIEGMIFFGALFSLSFNTGLQCVLMIV
jgi:hypothetical protein